MTTSIMLMNPKKKNRTWMFFAGAIGSTLLLFFDTQFRFYYETILGLNPTNFAIIWTVFAIWNAINDPVATYMSDRTKTRIGRRIPYILVSAVPFGLCFFFMFNPMFNLSGATQFQIGAYALVIVCLYDFFYTVAYSNYMMLIPEMFREQDKLRRFNFIRYAIFMVFAIGFTLLIPIIRGSAENPNMLFIGLIPAVLMPICLIVSAFGARENPMYSQTYKTPVIQSIKQTFKNKNFLAFVLYHGLYNIGKFLIMGNITILTVYVIKTKFLGMTLDGLMTPVVFVTMAAGLPLWNLFFKKVSKEWVNVIALIMCGVSALIMQFADSIIPVLIAALIFGAAQGGYSLSHDLYNARILDSHYAKTKQRAEGSYAGTGAFFDRILSLFGPWIIAGIAFFGGYDPTSISEQIADGQVPVLTEGAKIAIRTISGIAAAVLFFGGAAISAFCFKLRGSRWTEIETVVRQYDIELAEKAKILAMEQASDVEPEQNAELKQDALADVKAVETDVKVEQDAKTVEPDVEAEKDTEVVEPDAEDLQDEETPEQEEASTDEEA